MDFDKRLLDDNPFISKGDGCTFCAIVKPLIVAALFVVIAAAILHKV